jgi:hypothetical protein
VSDASGERAAERRAACCEEHFAPCYATGIAARMGAAPAGGVVGAVAASWRGGRTSLPDLVLVLPPVVFCCLPVTRI